MIGGVLCQKKAMPFDLYLNCNNNLSNIGTFAGVTSVVTGSAPNESQVAYVSGLAGATTGQALNIVRGGIDFNGTENLANGDVSWEFGCFINPLYQSYPLLKKNNNGNPRGWGIRNYYGTLYVDNIGVSNTYSQATNILPSNVVSKLKVVYDANAHTVKYYINDVLAATHTGITLMGYAGDLLRYASSSNGIDATAHHYIDDFYFKVL